MAFNPGDKVFAKMRGYPEWPARVISLYFLIILKIDVLPNDVKIPKGKYPVFFYGTHQISFIPKSNLKHFKNTSKPSAKNNVSLITAFEEIIDNPTIYQFGIDPQAKSFLSQFYKSTELDSVDSPIDTAVNSVSSLGQDDASSLPESSETNSVPDTTKKRLAKKSSVKSSTNSSLTDKIDDKLSDNGSVISSTNQDVKTKKTPPLKPKEPKTPRSTNNARAKKTPAKKPIKPAKKQNSESDDSLSSIDSTIENFVPKDSEIKEKIRKLEEKNRLDEERAIKNLKDNDKKSQIKELESSLSDIDYASPEKNITKLSPPKNTRKTPVRKLKPKPPSVTPMKDKPLNQETEPEIPNQDPQPKKKRKVIAESSDSECEETKTKSSDESNPPKFISDEEQETELKKVTPENLENVEDKETIENESAKTDISEKMNSPKPTNVTIISDDSEEESIVIKKKPKTPMKSVKENKLKRSVKRVKSTEESELSSSEDESPLPMKKAKASEIPKLDVVSQLLNKNRGLKSSLIKGQENFENFTKISKEIEEIEFDLLQLTKAWDLMETIKKCRRYKPSEIVRKTAERIYHRFQMIRHEATPEMIEEAKNYVSISQNKKTTPPQNSNNCESGEIIKSDSSPIKKNDDPLISDTCSGSKELVVDEEKLKEVISAELDAQVNDILNKIQKTEERVTSIEKLESASRKPVVNQNNRLDSSFSDTSGDMMTKADKLVSRVKAMKNSKTAKKYDFSEKIDGTDDIYSMLGV